MSNADIHLAGAYHNNDFDGESYDAGYAFDVGAKFNLDSVAKGDSFAVEYAYQKGAAGRQALILNSDMGDTYYGSDVNSGYSIGVSFHHVLSPRLSANLFGGYNSVEWNDGDLYKYQDTLLGANLDYEAVKNFHVKGEYYHVSEAGDYTESKSGFVVRIQRDF
jgi:hypothetical protein